VPLVNPMAAAGKFSSMILMDARKLLPWQQNTYIDHDGSPSQVALKVQIGRELAVPRPG